MSLMRRMSSKQIKDHYGDFIETARREPVIHTNHGRPIAVTIPLETARQIPELKAELPPANPTEGNAPQNRGENPFLKYLGRQSESRFKTVEEVDAAIRRERDAWP